MNDLDRLKQEFIDHLKCGRQEEAARTLAQRDELLLAELITKTEIARLFDVTQSAVSNWEDRYDDFPQPRLGRDRTARYSRTEIIDWWAARHPQLARALKQLEVPPCES